MIELRQLRHVLALAEHRNFVRAAEALGIAQPSLTRSIQGTEAQLGAVLFDRGTREVTPTALGELVIEHARAFGLAERDLARDIQLAKGLEMGELHVAAGPLVGAALVAEVLARMSRAHPRLSTRVTVRPCAELPDMLRRRDVELCVADANDFPLSDELEVLPLNDHPFAVVVRAGHPLAGLAGAGAHDLVGYPLAGVQLSEPMREKLLRQLKPSARKKVRADGLSSITCDHFSILKTVLLNSDAVALLSPFMFAEELRAGSLVALPGIRLAIEQAYGVVRLRGRTPSEPVRVFCELLAARDGEVAAVNRALLQSLRS